jgi:nucleotide-binding universal stress UspA family protein
MAPARIEIERILCPVDFSEFSARALERAVRLGNWFDARVEVLHVIPFVMPAGPGLPYFPAPPTVTTAQREQAGYDLDRFVETFLEEGVPIETRVREGDPWRLICDEAEAIAADLLVLGTHGRSGFEHLLLGSVTEKVLRRAHCPVLTVGNVPPHPRKGPLFRRILCAADLTPASEHTLDMALSLAEERRADHAAARRGERARGDGGAPLSRGTGDRPATP